MICYSCNNNYPEQGPEPFWICPNCKPPMFMNTPFTELPIPPKERMIISVHFAKAPDETTKCDICHTSRVSFADKRSDPRACDVCGRLLCWACFGSEGTLPGPDLMQVHLCDGCCELSRAEICAIIELRTKLSQP